MNTGIIIQARRSSSRFPDKVLRDMPAGSGISMLGRVITRAKNTSYKVIVATSEGEDDNAIAENAIKFGAEVFRGSLNDVLERYIKAAEFYNIDEIVRITSDCPCVEPQVIMGVLELRRRENADYASNVEPRTFPLGLDTEAVTLEALKKTDRDEKRIEIREHVTWHIRTSADFKKANLTYQKGDYSKIRVTVDTAEDYAVMNLIHFMLGDNFSYKDIISLYEKYPWLSALNDNIYHKYVFSSKEEEIREAIRLLKLHNMKNAQKILEDKANEE